MIRAATAPSTRSATAPARTRWNGSGSGCSPTASPTRPSSPRPCAAAKAEEEQIRTGIQALGSRPGTEMFDLVFQETTPALQAQAANWREESEHV